MATVDNDTLQKVSLAGGGGMQVIPGGINTSGKALWASYSRAVNLPNGNSSNGVALDVPAGDEWKILSLSVWNETNSTAYVLGAVNLSTGGGSTPQYASENIAVIRAGTLHLQDAFLAAGGRVRSTVTNYTGGAATITHILNYLRDLP